MLQDNTSVNEVCDQFLHLSNPSPIMVELHSDPLELVWLLDMEFESIHLEPMPLPVVERLCKRS